MSVLHRIEMNVIEMALKIRFVADGVLPETALPDFPLSALGPARRRNGYRFGYGTRKGGLE